MSSIQHRTKAHRPDCLCGACVISPLRAQPRALEALEPQRTQRVTLRATDRKRPPPCVTCAAGKGPISPHGSEYEVRDGDTGLVLTFTCEGGLTAFLSRVLLASLVLLMLACSSSSGGKHDAGAADYEPPIVGLFDAGDAGELEPDAEDLADAGELEPDAGELEPCEVDMMLCRSPGCAAVCREGFSYVCCELAAAAECSCGVQ
jgi:hypothetical protein